MGSDDELTPFEKSARFWMPFGIYRGQSIEDVYEWAIDGIDYLKWVISLPAKSLNPETRLNVETYLAGREEG